LTGYRDHHATIFVAAAIGGPIEAVRREWDLAVIGNSIIPTWGN